MSFVLIELPSPFPKLPERSPEPRDRTPFAVAGPVRGRPPLRRPGLRDDDAGSPRPVALPGNGR